MKSGDTAQHKAKSAPIVQQKLTLLTPAQVNDNSTTLGVQYKITKHSSNDPLKREADRVSDIIMRIPDQKMVQRKCSTCKEDDQEIQRKPLASFIQRKESSSGTVASDSISNLINANKGSGHSMNTTIQSFMQNRFGTDFSEIKIHTGNESVQMNRELNAKAFTVGNDIFFNEGQYNPVSSEGKHLLAHELTHTIQQQNTLQQKKQSIQRKPFAPWPGQIGEDVSDTFTDVDGVISERVQRTGDQRYSAPHPSLLEFNPSTRKLTATMEINFIPETNAKNKLTADEFDKLKKRILTVGNERLNGWIYIKAGGEKACSDKFRDKDISVEIIAKEGSGVRADTVMLGKDYSREDAGHLGKSASDWTIWHEMGHIVLGAPDEYADKGRPEERVNESDYSIMASSSSYGRLGLMHSRHFSHLAAWLGRKYAGCTFTTVEADRIYPIDITPSFTTGAFSKGLYYSLGVDMGIPLDSLRQFSFTIGPRINFSGDFSTNTYALLAGMRAGLRYKSVGLAGFESSLFGESGGIGFTDLSKGKFGSAPYAEAGVSLGFHYESFGMKLEGATGERTAFKPALDGISAGEGTESQKYYRMGLVFQFTR